jgi:hypothetical protein
VAPIPASPVSSGRRRATRPLLIAAVVAVLVVAGVVAALGGDDETPTDALGTTTTSMTDGDAGSAVEGELASRLVPLEDLGGPYTRTEPVGASTGTEPCGQENVDVSIPPVEVVGSLASDSGGTTSVTQSLRRYADADTAAAALVLTREAVACSAVSVLDAAGEAVAGDAGPMEELTVADARRGFLTELTFGTYVVTVGAVQVDEIVVSVQLGVVRTDGVDERELSTQLLSLLVTRLLR